MSELPDELAVLFDNGQALHILGPQQPWPYPAGWLEETRAKAAELVEDPQFAGVRAVRQTFKPDTPVLAEALNDLVWLLLPAYGILTGPGPRLVGYLVSEYLAKPSGPLEAPTSWLVRSGAARYFPLQTYEVLDGKPELRAALVTFQRRVLALFEGVPPLEPRRTVLAGILERIAADEELLAAHRTESRDDLIELWRQEFFSDDLAFEAFPEQSSNPLDLLVAGMARLAAAHEGIAAVSPETDQTVAAMVAGLIHQVERTDVPAGLAFTVLGRDGAADVQRLFEQQAAQVDRTDWRRRYLAWLARAIDVGAAGLAREWLAAMYLVGGVLKSLPGRGNESNQLNIVTSFMESLRNVHNLRRPRSITNAPAAPEEATDNPDAELAELIGLDDVKARMAELVAEAKVTGLRTAAGMRPLLNTRHLLFSGNPGTGKTTVARLLGRYYRMHRVLDSGHVVEVGRADLVGEFSGKTAPLVKEVVERALGGVLFIDEAYALVNTDKDLGREALATLVQEMENHRDELIVVLAGYPTEMATLLESNPGLRSRIGRTINFPDYTDDELLEIFRSMAARSGFEVAEETAEKVTLTLRRMPRAPGFGNARAVRSLLDQMSTRQAVRVAGLTDPTTEQVRTLLLADLPPLSGTALALGGAVPIENPEAELEKLVGLVEVKKIARTLAAEAKADVLRIRAGMKPTERTRHMVFTGNPGTGKTTVARLLAGIYRDYGLLGTGQLIEVGRGDLVAEYLGQTAPRVRKVVERALGGVLFIDEAYSLFDAHSYGAEAISTLVQLIEEHRDDLMVVLAGYTREMELMLDANSGLRSRFTTVLTFPDYSRDHLEQIYAKLATEAGYTLVDGLLPRASQLLEPFRYYDGFGNGRLIRTAFELTILEQATRITQLADPTPEQVRELTIADLPLRLPGGGQDATPYL